MTYRQERRKCSRAAAIAIGTPFGDQLSGPFRVGKTLGEAGPDDGPKTTSSPCRHATGLPETEDHSRKKPAEVGAQG